MSKVVFPQSGPFGRGWGGTGRGLHGDRLSMFAIRGKAFNIERNTVDGLPTVTATQAAWADAKVKAIDYSDRSIAAPTGPKGNTAIFTVGRDVRNFALNQRGRYGQRQLYRGNHGIGQKSY